MIEFLIEYRVMVFIWFIGYWIVMTATLIRVERRREKMNLRQCLAILFLWPTQLGIFMGDMDG